MKVLNLITQLGKYKRLENGVRFEHRGVAYDLRQITEAEADALAADPACKFLGKEGVEKKTPAAPTEKPAAGPKAGDAAAAMAASAPTEKKSA